MPVINAGALKVDVEQTGAGRPLVLLHSLLADRSAFDRVVPALSKKHRLVRVNLPGYGTSSPAGSSIEDYADWTAALLEQLDLPRETDVLGNGFGGFIAVALAARVQKEGMGAALDIAMRRMFSQSFIAAHPEIVEERKRALEKADAACFRTACLALAQLDLSAVLIGIGNRALVLAGSDDATTPPALARELASQIPGARFVEITGCGHCPQIERPGAFVEAVEGFLASGR
jgi:3-oxoadipate enol-lactonase